MALVLTEDQIASYKREGYLLVPDVFSLPELQYARTTFLTAFENELWKKAPYSKPDIINDIWSFFPDLIDPIFPPVLFNIIRDLIGDEVIWIPECSIHLNRYIHWHKDTSIQEISGETSHHNTNAPMIQAAIYFQDNNESGGGLTVLPRSHTQRDRYHKMMTKNLLKRSFYKTLKILGLTPMNMAERSDQKTTIASDIGSLLLFDLRIDHRSTTPQKNAPHIDKLAIFNTFGGNNKTTRDYLEFMKKRSEPYYRYLQEYPLPESIYNKAKESMVTIWY